MLNVRSRDFQFNEGCGTFEYQESNFNRIPVGEWRTVSIPIAEFKKTSKSVSNDIGFEFRPGVPPVTDGVVFNLLVNSEKIDQQMWIDKIWVTQEPVLE
jgi:hypothetical protein